MGRARLVAAVLLLATLAPCTCASVPVAQHNHTHATHAPKPTHHNYNNAPSSHEKKAHPPAKKRQPPPPPAMPAPSARPRVVVWPLLLAAAATLLGGAYHFRGILSAMAGDGSLAAAYSLKIASFLALVALQTTAILLFKVCQEHGAYSFSPASSIAMTEALKFAIASSLHVRHYKSSDGPLLAGVTTPIVLNYAGLSALYTINNYITFEVHTIADPGSYTLGKSVTPYVVAAMLRLTGARLYASPRAAPPTSYILHGPPRPAELTPAAGPWPSLRPCTRSHRSSYILHPARAHIAWVRAPCGRHALQWVCIVLQCGCLVVAQYDACRGVGAVPPRAYFLIALSVCITATCGVWNQKVIQGFGTPVNLQNAIMYAHARPRDTTPRPCLPFYTP